MERLHVFISTGRFGSFAEMRAFIDATYTEDGDGIPSAFIREVQLKRYEPMCIEAIHSVRAVPLSELLARASYADQWLGQLRTDLTANAAICVFPPNVVESPHASSLTYIGAFSFQVEQRAPHI